MAMQTHPCASSYHPVLACMPMLTDGVPPHPHPYTASVLPRFFEFTVPVACSMLDCNRRPLPPCIVMEKGESLDKWVQRNNRDMDQFTCMQVRAISFHLL